MSGLHMEVSALSLYDIPSLLCSTTFITCPADPSKTLGIKLPFLVMIIKNLKKYFTFEVQVSASTECLHAIYDWVVTRYWMTRM